MPSRLSLLFDEEAEPETVEATEAAEIAIRQGGVHYALAEGLRNMMPVAKDPKVQMLFEVQDVFETKELLKLHQGYHIALVGEGDEEVECIKALLSRHGPVFDRTRSLIVGLDNPTQIDPVAMLAMGFQEIATWANCSAEHHALTEQIILASIDPDMLMKVSHDEIDFVDNHMKRLKAARTSPDAWEAFIGKLISNLQRGKDFPSDGMLCVLLRPGFTLDIDYSRFLARLEELSHPRLLYILQMSPDLLKMAITTNYAKGWTTNDMRLTDEQARNAQYNATHDMMKYIQLFQFVQEKEQKPPAYISTP